MPTHTGSEGTVKIGSATLGEIRSFNLNITTDVIEDTSMGDSFRSFKAGLSQFTADLEVFFDETDAAQNALDPAAQLTLELYPEGAESGDTYFTGTVIVTSKTVTSTVDGMVEASFTAQGTGGITETTL
tara:strand:- start:3206 stop:3592 length:387 start_codon:yes stop_codon:yes gene_type:complete